MTKDNVQVAVDTAFFVKLTEEDSKGELFKNIMDQMGRSPVMHKHVFNAELSWNSTAHKLVKEGSLCLVDYSVYLTDADKRANYDQRFRHAYKGMNGSELLADTDIFSYQATGENIGEIHTALMAQHMGIDLMVSHDYGAKKYIEEHMSSTRHKLLVWNIEDVFKSLANSNQSIVKWKSIKGVAKRLFGMGETYDSINKCWHPESAL